jgi:thiol-disulfide isomerase/thioredoxin
MDSQRINMSKRFLFLVLGAVGGCGLVIGLAAARTSFVVREKSALVHAAVAGKAAMHNVAARVARPNEPRASGFDDSNPDVKSAASSAQDASARVVRFASNPEAAPPFLLLSLDGKPVSSAEWKGKVVILNFWATWCEPCREEIPEMIDLSARYKDRVEVIGASVDEAQPGEVFEFVKKIGITYPVVMAGPDLVGEYGGVPALPTSFVIDTQGRVVQKHVGLYPTEVYETEIRSLLGLPVNATVETFKDTGQIFLKNAAFATELPGVNLKTLNEEQKKVALKQMNARNCDCGCGLTIAQCRINDSSCPISLRLAKQIVKDAEQPQTPAPAAPTTPPPPSTNPPPSTRR